MCSRVLTHTDIHLCAKSWGHVGGSAACNGQFSVRRSAGASAAGGWDQHHCIKCKWRFWPLGMSLGGWTVSFCCQPWTVTLHISSNSTVGGQPLKHDNAHPQEILGCWLDGLQVWKSSFVSDNEWMELASWNIVKCPSLPVVWSCLWGEAREACANVVWPTRSKMPQVAIRPPVTLPADHWALFP